MDFRQPPDPKLKPENDSGVIEAVLFLSDLKYKNHFAGKPLISVAKDSVFRLYFHVPLYRVPLFPAALNLIITIPLAKSTLIF